MRFKEMLIIVFALSFCLALSAQTPEVKADPTPIVVVAEAPAPTPVEANPDVTTEAPKVLVSEAVAPPAWLEKLLDNAASIPFIGKYAVEVVKYLGVIASILTLLVTFLVGVVRVLAPIASFANFTKFATILQAFEASKTMYYLKFFSMYNAKKAVKDGEAPKSS